MMGARGPSKGSHVRPVLSFADFAVSGIGPNVSPRPSRLSPEAYRTWFVSSKRTRSSESAGLARRRTGNVVPSGPPSTTTVVGHVCAPRATPNQRPSSRVADVMEKVVNLSKRRGFVFPSAEIYGGFRSTYDYGPIGVLLLRNVKDAWWRSMVQLRTDVVGLDAAILSPPAVWEASGHLTNFTDPLVECRELPHPPSGGPSGRPGHAVRRAARPAR